MKKKTPKKYPAKLAKALAVLCVRDTFLEVIHQGKNVTSKIGDFSDVKIITPDRDINWNDACRITDDEMKKLMQEITNKLYTVLASMDDDEAMSVVFDEGSRRTYQWDDPQLIPKFLAPKEFSDDK